MVTKKVHLKGAEEALRLFGQNDHNLRSLEQNYGVQIFGRGDILSIRGSPGKVDKALVAIDEMREQIRENSSGDSSAVINGAASTGSAYMSNLGKAVRPRTAMQKEYVRAIDQNDMVIAIGPAGTGKTFLAVACALAALRDGRVTKIILTRPVVEAGEKLGFLPGDFYEKVNPYLRPLYDAFHTMLGPDKFRLYRDEETIEIAPLAYMRGRTLENAFIILDEGQNATAEQMKMLLTRMGEHSKIVVNGDVTQIDLNPKRTSGLIKLPDILKGVPGLEFIYFTAEDVVRHPLVKQILVAYDAWEKQQQPQQDRP